MIDGYQTKLIEKIDRYTCIMPCTKENNQS